MLAVYHTGSGFGAVDADLVATLQQTLNWLTPWVYRSPPGAIPENGALNGVTMARLRDVLEYATDLVALPYAAERFLDAGAPANYPFTAGDIKSISDALIQLIADVQEQQRREQARLRGG